jgi:hypothetical protein
MKKTFAKNVSASLLTGRQVRRNFLRILDNMVKSLKEGNNQSIYVYGPPGIGKTFSIKKVLDENSVKYVFISGNTSMFAFGIILAVTNFLNKNNEKVVVLVDDCDMIFSNETNCNIMKNVLADPHFFTYEKALQSQMGCLNELQKEAIVYHQTEDKMGFVVPTFNMVFIFTSNYSLPTDDDVKAAREKNQNKSIMLSHKNAIRSRCNVADFDLPNHALWGWIADVVFESECLNKYEMELADKEEILNYTRLKWSRLKERSLRLVEKMAIIKQTNPVEYKTMWDFQFLK